MRIFERLKSRLPEHVRPYSPFIVMLVIAVVLWVLLGLLAYNIGSSWEVHGQFGDMFGVANALFSGIGLAGVVYAIILQQRQLQEQMKEMDLMRILSEKSLFAEVLMECNRRFDLVARTRTDTATAANPKLYFDHFWSLQHDQFVLYENGTISLPVYSYWMSSRKRDFEEDYRVGTSPTTYQESWERIKLTWNDTDPFFQFMDHVHNNGPAFAFEWLKAYNANQ